MCPIMPWGSREKRNEYMKKSRRNRAEYNKKYHEDNREKISMRKRKFNKERGKEFRQWKEIAGPCLDCRNSDGRVLTFHHVNPKEKLFDLTVNKWSSLPLLTLIEELSKCIVLCWNCHMIREFETGKWS